MQPVVAGETTLPGAVAQLPLSAPVLYVNPASGNDAPGSGTEAQPYRTITYALQQAQSGSVIQLARGSYTKQTGEVFPLRIPAGVMLRGEPQTKGTTVAIIGGGEIVSPTFARQNVTLVANNDTGIWGVAVTNPNVRGTGIWVESVNTKIQDSTFANSHREGIFLTGTANPVIENCAFIKNGGNGISIANNAKGEIRGNLFQNTGFGLAVSQNATPLIVGNQIIQNQDGIYINDNARPILRKNVIENNQRDGIVATVRAQPDLGSAEQAGENVLRNNRQYDLHNATGSILYSVGNQLNQTKTAGQIEFIAPVASGQSAFTDVQAHWAQAYIDALAQRNIISGFPGGLFRPNDPVTRVQFAAIINKAFSPTPAQPAPTFQDINTSFWGYQAIQTATRGGFMKGYPEGVFKPNQAIPRVQVLVALANGLNYNAGDTNLLSKFQDFTQIPSWAIMPVAAATQRKVVVNYPSLTLLNPNREATRAEVAAFVYQALVNAGKAEAIASPYIVQVP
jgi:parallel beta-helix repeat protein